MPPKAQKYDAAADLLERVLKRSRYSTETHEAVTNFLRRNGSETNQYVTKLEAENKDLKGQVAKLQTRIRMISNDY